MDSNLIEDLRHMIPEGRPLSTAERFKASVFATRAADEIEELRAKNLEMHEALDSAEIGNGLTDNGNLWRFWIHKACDAATRNLKLMDENARLRRRIADLEKQRFRY